MPSLTTTRSAVPRVMTYGTSRIVVVSQGSTQLRARFGSAFGRLEPSRVVSGKRSVLRYSAAAKPAAPRLARRLIAFIAQRALAVSREAVSSSRAAADRRRTGAVPRPCAGRAALRHGAAGDIPDALPGPSAPATRGASTAPEMMRRARPRLRRSRRRSTPPRRPRARRPAATVASRSATGSQVATDPAPATATIGAAVRASSTAAFGPPELVSGVEAGARQATVAYAPQSGPPTVAWLASTGPSRTGVRVATRATP